jgi:hypothetical protein
MNVHNLLQKKVPQHQIEITQMKLYLNANICKILLNNSWWDAIETLQDILLPYWVF